MSDFDVNEPLWLSLSEAEGLIQSGWIAQFRQADWISRVIGRGTMGIHSHSAMFRRSHDNEVDLLELLQFQGGHARPFMHMEERRGICDVFSTCRQGLFKDVFDPEGCVDVMRQLTGYDYGWMGLFRMVLRVLPILWRLTPLETSDIHENPKPRRPFCSHAVAIATRIGGKVRPVLRLPAYYITPNHLTWSLFYDYEFTLITPWAIRKGYYKPDSSRHYKPLVAAAAAYDV